MADNGQRRRGRPTKPPEEKLGESGLTVYFSEADREAIQRAALASGKSESAWARDILVPLARVVLRSYRQGLLDAPQGRNRSDDVDDAGPVLGDADPLYRILHAATREQ